MLSLLCKRVENQTGRHIFALFADRQYRLKFSNRQLLVSFESMEP